MTHGAKYKLGDVAEMAIGYQHREKVSHVEHGTHRLIQGKDIVRSEDLADDVDDRTGWRVLTQDLDQITPKGDASRYRIQSGDLLFVSRGTTNIAVPLVEPFIKPMPLDWNTLIPAYVFYVLRPDRQRVLSEYLAWFINQPPSQAYLARHSRGTLVKLFLKYLSDLWTDLKYELNRKYKNDKTRVARALARERFVVPAESHFDHLYGKRREANIGDLINMALADIEDKNRGKLEGVFRNIDFNSEANLGKPKDRNARLIHLLEDFHDPRLDLRPSRIGGLDVIGNAYEFLIGNFASDAGKKAGEFYTPPEVSLLLTQLLQPSAGSRIGDPACGSGSLLIKMGQAVPANAKGERDVSLYGMEANGATWALCKMNMFLHGFDQARVEWCDTLRSPALVERDALMKFDVVVANPPFSLDKWGDIKDPKDDKPYNRFHRGVPPKSKGDYAFISHMIETTVADSGKVGVICPHGVLFRGGQEGVIRRKLIEENLLDAVIGLPANLFYGTGIPAAILIFDRSRTAKRRKHVLFIDASREFAQEKRQNRLRDEDLAKIVKTYMAYKPVDKYAYRATLKEIAENEFNLNIPRYVDTFEGEEEIDIEAVQQEIDGIEIELAKTRKQMAAYLKELGFD